LIVEPDNDPCRAKDVGLADESVVSKDAVGIVGSYSCCGWEDGGGTDFDLGAVSSK